MRGGKGEKAKRGKGIKGWGEKGKRGKGIKAWGEEGKRRKGEKGENRIGLNASWRFLLAWREKRINSTQPSKTIFFILSAAKNLSF
jgi:hypothetical protein